MYAVNTKKGVNSALQADTLSNITIKQFLDIYKQIPLFSGDLSQDVKNKLGITRKSELENLKFAKELTFEQNDRIAQTYNIEYYLFCELDKYRYSYTNITLKNSS